MGLGSVGPRLASNPVALRKLTDALDASKWNVRSATVMIHPRRIYTVVTVPDSPEVLDAHGVQIAQA